MVLGQFTEPLLHREFSFSMQECTGFDILAIPKGNKCFGNYYCEYFLGFAMFHLYIDK